MSLQREIKKKRPFQSLEQEAMLNILRTSDQHQLQFARRHQRHKPDSFEYFYDHL